jgi:tRNA 2-thiouridine synthesizing protein D
MCPLRYTLLVTGPPYGTQRASSAYLFAQACVAAGHDLAQIFFYQAGVLNANGFTAPASDEFDIVASWQQLARQYGVALLVCSAAALRRGVLDQSEAFERSLVRGNLAPGFTLAGLTDLTIAVLSSDRCIQF